jgi:ASC-1-like (ASCH) protein
MHEIGIESSLVEAIRNGEKTIEGCLGKPRFLQIKEGDTIRIREDIWKDGEIIGAHDDSLRVVVTQILFFETFKEMLEAVNFEAAVPTADTIKEAIATYATFYAAQDEAEYGVVALFFKLIE